MTPLSLRCASPTAPVPLTRFETCDELELFLADRLLHPGEQGGGGVVVGCADELASAPSDGAEGEGERTFTTTNTQEIDVDEPDFVKNDGDNIFVLHRGRMVILDAWPPTALDIVSETEISGVPFTMFFDGETRAMVLSRETDSFAVTASLFDVTDRAAPVLRRKTTIEAEYVDARRVGDDIVIVTRSFVRADDVGGLRDGPFHDDENIARIRAAGIDGLVPRIIDRVVGRDEVVTRAVRCENTYAPVRGASADLVMTHTLSIGDEAAAIKSTAVVGAPGSVYASKENLYLIGTEFFDGGYFTPGFAVTRIHKLGAFGADDRAPYLGSVTLEGTVKDELSVDEDPASGTLRVVVTENDSTDGDERANVTSLVVLQEGADLRLEEIARVSDIGHGEVVESVRFLGDRAYVVTFPPGAGEFSVDDTGMPRVPFLDPLFVIDLEDVSHPRLRGELTVEGYSAYLHPLGEDHLLAVGVRVDDTSGAFLGLQLQIFDVRDPGAPTLLHRTSFGDEASGSEALVDRHAFTYFDDVKKLAIPFQRLGVDEVRDSALLVFDVDLDAGLTLLGEVDQMPLWRDGPGSLPRDDARCGAVRRSVMMNDPELGAFVYAISTAGVTVAPLTYGTPTAHAVPFSVGTACDFRGGPL